MLKVYIIYATSIRFLTCSAQVHPRTNIATNELLEYRSTSLTDVRHVENRGLVNPLQLSKMCNEFFVRQDIDFPHEKFVIYTAPPTLCCKFEYTPSQTTTIVVLKIRPYLCTFSNFLKLQLIK